MARLFFVLGAALGGLTVALGAFGSHALQNRVPEDLQKVWQVAVHYQGLHSLALLALGVFALHETDPLIARAGALFVAGIVLFSGSLYALALTGVRGLGAITPIGGLCFLAAWFLLAWAAWRSL